jgi:uncharacterized protein
VDITPLIPAGRQIVESYGQGRFRVSGTSYKGSVIIFPERTLAWPIAAATEVTVEALAEVTTAGRTGGVELLLLGCGARMALVPSALRAALKEAGIAIEPMDTGAACRTYNLLMADGRRVAAALIAVD